MKQPILATGYDYKIHPPEDEYRTECHECGKALTYDDDVYSIHDGEDYSKDDEDYCENCHDKLSDWDRQ